MVAADCGAAQGAQVCADAECHAHIPGNGADVRPTGALDVEFDVREVDAEEIDAVDLDLHRLELHIFASTHPVVGPLARHFLGRVGRRNLPDAADLRPERL